MKIVNNRFLDKKIDEDDDKTYYERNFIQRSVMRFGQNFIWQPKHYLDI